MARSSFRGKMHPNRRQRLKAFMRIAGLNGNDGCLPQAWHFLYQRITLLVCIHIRKNKQLIIIHSFQKGLQFRRQILTYYYFLVHFCFYYLILSLKSLVWRERWMSPRISPPDTFQHFEVIHRTDIFQPLVAKSIDADCRMHSFLLFSEQRYTFLLEKNYLCGFQTYNKNRDKE